MNILIVDDDAHVVQGVQRMVSWERLGIDRVYTAGNVRQAKMMMASETMDILLCDIEMPQASGLDFLAWIRSEGYDVQALFLTSYANFDYVQQALKLESLEYYLKPVNYGQLTAGLEKAVKKAEEQRRGRLHRIQSQYWELNRKNVTDHFWSRVVQGAYTGNQVLLQRDLAGGMLPYKADDQFVPVLFEILDRAEQLRLWSREAFAYAMENIARELAQDQSPPLEAVAAYRENLWTLIFRSGAVPTELEGVCTIADRFIRACNDYLGLNVFCMVDEGCAIKRLPDILDGLREILRENVTCVNQVMLRAEYEQRNMEYRTPSIGAWESMLKNGCSDALLQEVSRHLLAMQANQEVNRQTLKQFRLDITQMVYAYLTQREIQAHRLFLNDTSERLYEYAVVSIEDMLAYFRHLLEAAVAYAEFTDQPESIVKKLIGYIHQNCSQEISRTELAESVYLNPDYVSRLFKKEMGTSISAYLMNYRIDKARRLLSDTAMPIHAVAISVGYDNFAYFSKIFHQRVAMSPNEYRKCCREQARIKRLQAAPNE